jgi:hypothetical protein
MKPLDIALDYIARGWNPVPVPHRSKVPTGDAWQNLIINKESAAQHFNGGAQNIGVQMGNHSGGLADTDLDCGEAIAVAPYLLPVTKAIFGRPGARDSHWLYTTDLYKTKSGATIKFEDPCAKQNNQKATLVELRIGGLSDQGEPQGAQTVFPGSTHKSGEPITWIDGAGDPMRVAGADLLCAVKYVAVAALIVRSWPAEGARHDVALTLGGFLARAGLDKTKIKLMVEAIAKAAGDTEWKDRVKAAEDHAEHHEKTNQGRGFPALKELVGEARAKRIAEWLDYAAIDAQKTDAIHSWDDPDWSLLDDRRGELLDFPLDVLQSAALKHCVTQAARGAGTNVDQVIIPLLGVASGLVGTARRVQATTSWTQPLTLWMGVIGFSGTGKTPGLDVTKRVLSEIQRARQIEIDALRRAHETAVEVAKIELAKWEAEAKTAINGGGTAPPKPAAADKLPEWIVPRMFVSDATTQKLGVLLQARPAGMTLILDELSGLFANMSRYSDGDDRPFWLEAWNGGAYSVERLGRPPVTLDSLLIGVVGGFQPDKLSQAFGEDGDGMSARFLYSWLAEPAHSKLIHGVAEVDLQLLTALTRLAGIGHVAGEQFTPQRIALSEYALDLFESLRLRVYNERRLLDGREREYWAKIPAHTLRLAGTLAFLQTAFAGSAEVSDIRGDVMQTAVTLMTEYFWPHAQSALRQAGLSDRHAVDRKILKWIRGTGEVEVSVKDIRRDCLHQSLDAETTQAHLERLERAGWLRKMTTPTKGRALIRWSVNPALSDQTAPSLVPSQDPKGIAA